jgi:hypothetical protein
MNYRIDYQMGFPQLLIRIVSGVSSVDPYVADYLFKISRLC